MELSPPSARKTNSSTSPSGSFTDDPPSPKDLRPVKLDEAHFARDPADRGSSGGLSLGRRNSDRGVQILVDSSESRTITAAQNFEGLGEEKKPLPSPSNKPRGEKGESSSSSSPRAGGEQRSSSKLPGDGETTGAGVTRGGDTRVRAGSDSASSAKPKLSSAESSGGKEQGHSSSSRLQVQLKEYDRRKLEEEDQRREGGRVRPPPPTLAKAPPSPLSPPSRGFPSPVRTLGEGGSSVRFRERSGSSGDSWQQASVRSPDSSSSSSATQVLGRCFFECNCLNRGV